MIDVVSSVTVLVVALLAFVAIGRRGSSASSGPTDGGLDDYVVARGSQGAGALGPSFLASGLGVWILFAPAGLEEVGEQLRRRNLVAARGERA